MFTIERYQDPEDALDDDVIMWSAYISEPNHTDKIEIHAETKAEAKLIAEEILKLLNNENFKKKILFVRRLTNTRL